MRRSRRMFLVDIVLRVFPVGNRETALPELGVDVRNARYRADSYKALVAVDVMDIPGDFLQVSEVQAPAAEANVD
jgi:hypothetical protein